MHIDMCIYFHLVSVRSISSTNSRHTCEVCSILISKALSFSSLWHDLNWCDFGCLEIILVIWWLDFSSSLRELISWLLLWNTRSSLLLHAPLFSFPRYQNSSWGWSTAVGLIAECESSTDGLCQASAFFCTSCFQQCTEGRRSTPSHKEQLYRSIYDVT